MNQPAKSMLDIASARGEYAGQVAMKTIREKISAGAILLSDGAWGTLLQKKGLKPGECPDLWCLERRSEVFEIAKAYVAAGCDMLKTNSFGGNVFKLAFFGLQDKADAINAAAAEISRAAAGPDRHVIASMGPTGKMLLMGDVTEEQMKEAFARQAKALASGGADAVCIETMSDLDEASLAIKAVAENTDLEIICTFTFEKTASGEYRTMMGVSPTQMAEACLAAGADIIGSNCGNGFEQMPAIVAEMRQAAPSAPILVHANAGLPRVVDGKTIFPDTPEAVARHVPAILAAGANIVGGCCGTTPDHIRAIARAIADARRP